MSIDTFLFDLDGTLVDSVADLATAVNLLRGELDLPPLPLAAVRSYVGDGATLLVQRSLPSRLYSALKLQRFLQIYGDHLLEKTVPYPGIREFLETLHDRRMAVVTNKPLALTLLLLDGLQLRHFFPVVLGGDSCSAKKPDPAPVVAALKQLQRPPESAVMIGDHHTDLRAGRAAGVRTCFCAWGIGETGGVASDFFAETPSDLRRLFSGSIP